jgi:hypothetical protein
MFKFHFNIILPNSVFLNGPFHSGIQYSVQDSILSHAWSTANLSCHYSLISHVSNKHYTSRSSALYIHFLPFPLPSVHTLSWSLWTQIHSIYNYQQAVPFKISLVLLHSRNTTLSVSFWNISKFCVPVLDDKASLPSLQKPHPDLIMICTNPVHIFTTHIIMFSVTHNSLFC